MTGDAGFVAEVDGGDGFESELETADGGNVVVQFEEQAGGRVFEFMLSKSVVKLSM